MAEPGVHAAAGAARRIRADPFHGVHGSTPASTWTYSWKLARPLPPVSLPEKFSWISAALVSTV